MPRKKVIAKKITASAKKLKKGSVRKPVAKKPKTRKTVIKLETPAFSPAAVSITPILAQNSDQQTLQPAQPVFHAPKSPHLLDLKKISFENHIQETNRQQVTKDLQRHIHQELRQVTEKAQTTAKKWPELFARKKSEPVKFPAPEPRYHLPKETIVSQIILEEPTARTQNRFRLPSIKIPRITWQITSVAQSLPKASKHLFSSSYTRRSVVSFVIASLVLVSPLWAFDTYQKISHTKGAVTTMATSALDDLRNGADANALAQAAQKLQAAEQELENVPDLINAILAAAPEGTKLGTGKKLLIIAKETSSLAQTIVSMLANTQDSQSLYERLGLLLPALSEQKNSIEKISADIASIDARDIPEAYREQFSSIATIISGIAPHIDALFEQAHLLHALMGVKEAQRYLLVFQNTNELRATGGFMGSFATLSIKQGVVEEFNIPPGGTYDLQAGLKANIEPPHPLTAVVPRWEFQDANYFADFPTSAKKIMSLYEKSGGTTVNGVIAINSTILPYLLELTGPISLPESGMTVSSENVIELIEAEVETGPNKQENKPKKILGELSGILLKTISQQSSNTLPRLAEVLLHCLTTREIQLHLKDPQLQEIVERRRWDGSLIKTNGDYLSIVSTNIAGGKSNSALQDSVNLLSEIQEDGSVINTLRLTRTHLGNPAHPLADIKNNDYLRVYVPLSSTLISAHGFEPLPDSAFTPADFPTVIDPDLAIVKSTTAIDLESKTEIYAESGKTVFANWIQVNPGETKTVTIKYRLPFKITANTAKGQSWIQSFAGEITPTSISHSLIIQKQSGKQNQTYHVEISAPASYNYRWLYPSNISQSNGKFTLDQLLDRDAIIGIIFTKQ